MQHFSLSHSWFCASSLYLFLNPDGGSVVLCPDITLPQKLVDSTEFIRCIKPVPTFCTIKYIVKYCLLLIYIKPFIYLYIYLFIYLRLRQGSWTTRWQICVDFDLLIQKQPLRTLRWNFQRSKWLTSQLPDVMKPFIYSSLE